MVFFNFINFNLFSLVPLFFFIFFTFFIVNFNEKKIFRIAVSSSILIIIFSFFFALNAFFSSDLSGYIYSFFTIFIAILNFILGIITGLNHLEPRSNDENEESKLNVLEENVDY